MRSSVVKLNAPGLAPDARLTLRKRTAGEQGDVHSPSGIANRGIADDLDLGGARGIGEGLAMLVVDHVHPQRPVDSVFRSGEVNRLLCRVLDGKGCVLLGILRPGRRG